MTDQSQDEAYAITDHKSYVKIRYRVQIADGPVLKGAVEPEIMDFVTGFLHVIPGLEARLLGRQIGEKLSFTVPPEEAFGVRHPELVIEKRKADFHFPAGIEPYPGMELPIITGHADTPETVMIREIRDDTIVIDLNHPLSGLPLIYDLEILEARPASSTDVCSEWEAAGGEHAACSSIPQIVLGGDEP